MAGLARLGVPGGGRAVGGEPLPWAPASLPTALPPLPCRSLPCSACRERGSLRWLGGRRRHPASPRPSPPSPFSPPSGLFQPPPFPAMRRPPRRLTLAVLGVLWIAALLLLFFGARRKPAAAAGPEGRTAEVRGGGSGTGLGDGAGSPHGAGAAAGGRRHPRCPGKEVAGHLRDTPAARLPRKFGTGSVLAGGDGEVRVGLCSPRSSSCPPLPAVPQGSAPSPALLLGQGTTTCRDLGISQPLQGEKRAPALRSGASPRETVREPSGGARAEPRPASPPCPRALGLGFVPRWEAGCR